jgi:hypothetical protein
MGRKPIGRKAMTNVERQRRYQAKLRAAKLKRVASRIEAVAKLVIAAALAGGDLNSVPRDTREGYITSAEDVIAGLRAAGLSIVRTSTLR